MSRPSSCNCASCLVCTCPNGRHRCDTKARRPQPQPPLRYTPEQLTSVTKGDYRPPTADELRNARAQAGKPEWSAINSAQRPDVRFDAQSEAQSTYRGEQNPRPASAHRPFFDRGADAPARPSLPFDARTRYQDEFQAHSLKEAANARSVPADRHLQSQLALHPPGAQFDGSTTNRREFRQYELERPRSAAPPPPQRGPPLKFEGQTQTQADYGRKQRDPSQPLGHRHPEAQPWVKPQSKFDAHTVNQDTYRGHQPPPSRPSPAPMPQPRPSLPFQGESQTRADYRPYDSRTLRETAARAHGDAHASHFKNPHALWTNEPAAKGTYVTETRGQYTHKQEPPCPAAAWETPVGGRTPYTY